MTREEQREYLRGCFYRATAKVGNPGDKGVKVRVYADFVAFKILQGLATYRPTAISREDAFALADGLHNGDFDTDLAGWMGYC